MPGAGCYSYGLGPGGRPAACPTDISTLVECTERIQLGEPWAHGGELKLRLRGGSGPQVCANLETAGGDSGVATEAMGGGRGAFDGADGLVAEKSGTKRQRGENGRSEASHRQRKAAKQARKKAKRTREAAGRQEAAEPETERTPATSVAEAEAALATVESALRTTRRHAISDVKTAMARGVQLERKKWKKAKAERRHSSVKVRLSREHEAKRAANNRRKTAPAVSSGRGGGGGSGGGGGDTGAGSNSAGSTGLAGSRPRGAARQTKRHAARISRQG